MDRKTGLSLEDGCFGRLGRIAQRTQLAAVRGSHRSNITSVQAQLPVHFLLGNA